MYNLSIMNTNPDTKTILDLWHYAEGLKLENRNVRISTGRHESVAEHCWRMAFMLITVAPRLKTNINLERALKIALVHDIAETEAKDVPSSKHFENKKVKDKKEEDEMLAIKNIQKRFGDIGEEIANIWKEYEDQKTDEAKVVKALDKLDARVQVIDDKQSLNITDDGKEIIKRLSLYTKELCSIDELLVDLDSSSLEERQEKWGF